MNENVFIVFGLVFWCFVFWRGYVFLKSHVFAGHVGQNTMPRMQQSQVHKVIVHLDPVVPIIPAAQPVVTKVRRCDYCKQIAGDTELVCSHCGGELPHV